MITILTTFKPFIGDDFIRQNNALASWRALGADLEIMVFGQIPGLQLVSEKFRVRSIPEVPVSGGNLPSIDAIFEFAQVQGKYDLQAYVNGDIILMEDFVSALKSIHFTRFVMTGQRLDVNVQELLDFSDKNNLKSIKRMLLLNAVLHDVGGMDYFAYRRGSIPPLPRLYLGSAAWDNILVFASRKSRIPVIDATFDIQAFHQDHAHKRLGDGQRMAYDGPAAKLNRSRIQDEMCLFYTIDASHWLKHGKVKTALLSPRHAWRMVLTIPVLHGWHGVIRWPFRLVAGLVRRLGVLWIRLPKSENFSFGK